MDIDLKHLAKCLQNDCNPDFTYIGQHFGETPGWGCLAAEVLRLSKINTQLVTDFNAMNQHGAKQDARITTLEAVVAAGDGLAALVEQEHSPNIDHHHPLEVSEGDWERIRAALTTYRVAKGAANG